MANRDPLLNFEEFVKQKNSFGLHFAGPAGQHIFGDLYRDQPWYRLCAAAHPELSRLAAELPELKAAKSPEYLPKLYEAYKLMHPYAGNNREMFT